LSILTYTPLVGALTILAFRIMAGANVASTASKGIALITSIIALVVSLVALSAFDANKVGYQFLESVPWFGGSSYKLGVDGMSIALIVLTTALTPLCVLQSATSIKDRLAEYMICFLVLEALMIGVFCALDLVLFYVFFEGGLIPMFLIIGVWGGKNKFYAAFKFFLYTLLGSLLLLIALIYMGITAGTTDVVVLQNGLNPVTGALLFPPEVQTWLWLAFFASFAVKLPMVPVHTWLPDAHVEAPTAGSVVLAAVMLKMGGYGFLRFSLPMFPEASQLFQPLMFTLSVVAIVYASLIAFRQTDIKKLVAYSSIAHMGFVTLGIFAFNEIGIQGAIFQMISHGVISGALFFCVGVIYDRMHTREIAFYGGLVHRMPVYAALFMLFSMANVGLPGTSGFIGEILTMVGGFQASTWAAAGAALGVIFSAVYMLTLYRRVVFGEMTNEKLFDIKDVTALEFFILGLLAIMALTFGVFPGLIFDLTKGSTLEILRMIGQ
ncbi:MAG TPA: NADH-quinone oxidoreductase subunit M, partial [Hyphomonadaceae bacterium]|nr:NADH-quinone oxidoreductase subunit M [Hyphomonadaceae bacterium]